MKKKNIKYLVWEDIILLIPLIIYGIYKNGLLIYMRGLTNITLLFKPLYLVLIGIIIKIVIDLIRYHSIKIDYDLLCLILVGMIMPYNINLIIYSITLLITYILLIIIEKYFKINKVCFIYLVILLINSYFNKFTFLNPLESKFTFQYSFFDLLFGRLEGGISSTNIMFTLMIYIYLTYNFYYKKDIPFFINITYILLNIIYILITKDNSYLLNSELIFGSIFVSTLPDYSPVKKSRQVLYAIIIGIIAFILAITYNKIISIYLATFIVSFIINIFDLIRKRRLNK